MGALKMNLRQALALSIKAARKNRNLTQEDLGVVSSRTYVSTLERGLKSPTIDKLDEISRAMGVHPASVVFAAYSILAGAEKVQELTHQILTESRTIIEDMGMTEPAKPHDR